MARDNIILPHKIYKSMRNLSDAECGRLFRALLQYSMGESQQIKLHGREVGLFDVYSQDIDDDIAAYEAKCNRNRANGSQSGPVGASRPQSPPVAPSGSQSPYNNNNNNNNRTFGPYEEDEEINNTPLVNARAAIDRAWRRAYGKKPGPDTVDCIAQAGIVRHFEADVMGEAVRMAGLRNAGDPVAYALTLFRDWDRADVRTMEALEDYLEER